jgi:hypothetical protein
MQLWTLYCHTHIASGRRYIGVTKNTMLHRWNRHVYSASHSRSGKSHFANAIRKYGKDSFSHEVLCQSWSLDGANATEEELILQYDTRDPKKGFNLAPGGNYIPRSVGKNPWDDPEYRTKALERLSVSTSTPKARRNHKRAVRSPKYRAERRRVSRERGATDEFKLKISLANKGKRLSVEHRTKISATRKPKLSAEGVRQVRTLLSAGKSTRKIAKIFGISSTYVRDIGSARKRCLVI